MMKITLNNVCSNLNLIQTNILVYNNIHLMDVVMFIYYVEYLMSFNSFIGGTIS